MKTKKHTTIFVVTLPYKAMNKSNKSLQNYFTTIEKAHRFTMSELTRYKVHTRAEASTKKILGVWNYMINGVQAGNVVEKNLE